MNTRKTFAVFQIIKTVSDSRLINQEGRDAAFAERPHLAALDHLSFSIAGRCDYRPEHWRHFSCVAMVTATTLDNVFELCNLWNQPERVRKLDQCRSLSVGDIVLDTATGHRHIVEPIGFRDLDSFLQISEAELDELLSDD